jgi:exodeoxyribonuclease VII small subunit
MMREIEMTPTENDTKADRFEDQLERLEEIVANLEDETVGLEEALELFENGMELAKSCRARLEEVEKRVQQLLEAGEGDEPETAPLDDDDGDPDSAESPR